MNYWLLILVLIGVACTQEKTESPAMPQVQISAGTPSVVNLETTASGILIPMSIIPLQITGHEELSTKVAQTISNSLNYPGWFESKVVYSTTQVSGLGIYFNLKDGKLQLLWKDGANVLMEENHPIDGQYRTNIHKFLIKLIKEFHQENAALNSRILFVGGVGKERDISLMEWDGSGERDLLKSVGRASYPALSKDGSDLYYSSMKPGYSAVFHYDLPRKKLEQIRENHQDFQPRPSPDGRKLLFSELVIDNSDLWIMDLETKVIEPLVLHPAAETSASWTPNGDEIYFSSDRGGGPQIYKVNADGTDLSRVSYRGRYNTGATISPDGKKMVFTRMQGSRMALYLMDLRSGDEIQLTNMGNNECPSWSPDGRMITFASDRTGRSQIYLIRTDGSGLVQITHGAGAAFPRWSY